MLQLPPEEVRPDRIRQTNSRLVYGRHRDDRWHGGRLALLLPDWTASYSDSAKSA